MVSMMLVMQDNGLLPELLALAGSQQWHAALDTPGAPTTAPNIYTDDAPPELNRTVSQVSGVAFCPLANVACCLLLSFSSSLPC